MAMLPQLPIIIYIFITFSFKLFNDSMYVLL